MSTLQQFLQTKERKREDARSKVIGFIIAIPVCGWLFVWYNYVWIRWSIGYWQWTVFAVLMMTTPKWLSRPVCGIIGTVAVFAQVAAWFGLVTLPLIK